MVQLRWCCHFSVAALYSFPFAVSLCLACHCASVSVDPQQAGFFMNVLDEYQRVLMVRLPTLAMIAVNAAVLLFVLARVLAGLCALATSAHCRPLPNDAPFLTACTHTEQHHTRVFPLDLLLRKLLTRKLIRQSFESDKPLPSSMLLFSADSVRINFLPPNSSTQSALASEESASKKNPYLGEESASKKNPYLAPARPATPFLILHVRELCVLANAWDRQRATVVEAFSAAFSSALLAI
jgi:hypothetical protein